MTRVVDCHEIRVGPEVKLNKQSRMVRILWPLGEHTLKDATQDAISLLEILTDMSHARIFETHAEGGE